MRNAFIAAGLLIALAGAGPALAQKSGGVMKIQHWDSPASMSILEEATYSTVVPIMGVYNNLVMYKQDEPQNSMQTIMCDSFSPSLRNRMKTMTPSSSTPETERTMVAPCVVGWNRRTERERPKPVENGWHVQSGFSQPGSGPKTVKRVP